MTRPLSNDLRERVVAAVTAGESCRSVAARFSVSASTVVKWSQRHRATGSVAPGKVGGHRKPLLDPYRAFIVGRLAEMPNLTLHGLKDELAARGVRVSHNAVWQFLLREGLRFKKTLFALEPARADIARRRQRWRSWQADLDLRRPVFIDDPKGSAEQQNVDQDQHGAATRLGAEGQTPARLRPAWPLAHAHLYRGAALRPAHRTLRLRRTDQRPMLPCLCRATARPRPRTR